MPFFESDSIKIHYKDKGKGVPIIFIHPPLLTSENFYYQLNELYKNFRVLTFDMRGHGLSSPSHEKLTYSLIIKDIENLLSYLKIDKAYIGGYSTGGTIALHGLINSPEKFIGGIIVSGMSEVNDWRLLNEIKTAILLTKIGLKKIIAKSITKSNANNKEMYMKLYHNALEGSVNHWRQYYEYSLIYNCTSQLSEINQPVLLIYGDKNKMFLPYLDLIRKRIKKHKTYLIQGADHQIPTKNAKKMNLYIQQWLQNS